MTNFHVGQEVIQVSRHGAKRETEKSAVIERVGRKWVYIKQNGLESAFDAVTGREKSEFGYPSYIYTPEMRAAAKRRKDVIDGLWSLGVEWRLGGWAEKYSTETLDGVLALLAAGRNDKP